MRLFLAIYPPKEYIKYFAEVYRAFDKQKRNLKPIPYDQIHLTLRFIGANVSEQSKDLILELLEKYQGQYSSPSIKIDKIQFGFDRQRDPRHLIANVVEDEGLLQLSEEVHGVIKSLKLRDTIRWKDKYSDDFHITIARMKNTATKSSGKQVTKLLPFTERINIPEAFVPESFELMESIMRADGPAYRKLASIKI